MVKPVTNTGLSWSWMCTALVRNAGKKNVKESRSSWISNQPVVVLHIL